MSTVNNPMGSQQASPLQLNDIHLPDQINNFPMAIGWWLLAATLLISLILFIKYYQNKKSLNLSKYKALKQLNDSPNMSSADSITLLKWAAMQYFSRVTIANLYGDGFQQFLVKNLPLKHQERFVELSTPAFEQQYQNNNPSNGISSKMTEETSHQTTINKHARAATLLWLQNALPIQHTNKTSRIGASVHD